jgi:hypothetical protein
VIITLMLSYFSIFATGIGACAALAADHSERHSLLIRRFGGALIILGIALAGLAFRVVV